MSTAVQELRGARRAWCLFDFANSAFNTIVVTFVYAQFFAQALVGDQQRGDVLWARSLTVAGLLVAIASPVLGTVADRRGKRPFLVGFALICIVCTALLAFPSAQPGADRATEGTIWLALVLFTIANVAFELCFVFYNAFLPLLGDRDTIGRLSGNGWALGYAGGLGCLVLALGFVGLGDLGPWVPTDAGWNIRATNLLVAGWFLVFALPAFVRLRDRDLTPSHAAGVPGEPKPTWRELAATIRRLRSQPDLARLLVARLFYNDALMALIGLAALYMGGTLGMETGDIMLVAVWLNVAAGIGAFGFGFVDDRLGAKTVVVWSLVLLLGGCALAIAVPTPGAFWIAATIVGVGMGPNQAASRSMLGRFIKPAQSAEMYGLFALSGKATVWIGPLLFGIVRQFTDSQRIAFLPLIGLFAIGLVLVLAVDERRGVASADETDDG